MNDVNQAQLKTKWIFFSSIFMSALTLFIIGLEPYVPQIAQALPPRFRDIATVVLPVIIMLARQFNTNNPISLLPRPGEKAIEPNTPVVTESDLQDSKGE